MGILNSKKSRTKGNQGVALLAACDHDKLAAVMIAVVNAGHVIQFSQTRQGNALVVGVYDGKDNDKVYPETVEELNDVFDTILDALDAEYVPSEIPPPQVSGRQSRAPKGSKTE